MAKDVATFLAWAAEPEHDERKKMGFQWIGGFVFLTIGMLYYKRLRFSIYKNKRLEFR
jgi:ubiquinol-cytochrome c reductase cytochrome c1 subunit